MKTITLEEVQDAYTKHDLTPMRGGYFPDEGCACALGAFFYDFIITTQNEPDYGPHIELDMCRVNKLGYTTEYIYGFMFGFDLTELPDNNQQIIQGYEDGKRIGIALLGDINEDYNT